MPERDAQAIWAEVVERVKDRTISPSLWRALERAHGVVVENGTFVIGFLSQDMPMRGHLGSGEHRNTIEKVINDVARETLQFRIIEGITVGDWENCKKREAVANTTREAAMRRKQEEINAGKSWDVILEQVSRRYAKIPMRQLPQVRAQYLIEAIQMMSDFINTMFPDGAERDELSERSLARVIEKVAGLVEMSSTEVALKLLQYRGELK